MGIEDTKDKIISVATRLFSRFGFHKTSMDEIAKIARKAKGSLYYHFASKEELFKEVVLKEIVELKSELLLISTDASLSPTKKLRSYLTRRMEVLSNAPNYHETIKADFFEHFEFIDDIRNDLDVWEKDMITSIVLEGIEIKEFTVKGDIDVLAEVIIMVLKGLEIPFFIQGKYKKYSPHFEDLMNLVTKGLSS